MAIDPKAIRRAIMVAKNIAASVSNVPLMRAKGGQVNTIQGPQRQQNLDRFMEGAHPALFNKDGTPKVLYHGTSKDFSTFKPGTYLGNVHGVGGIYLTSDPHVASEYSRHHGDTGRNVMPVHVNMKNAYVLKKGEYAADAEQLKAQGYDGIIDGDTFVPFHPHQIKSAVGNVGTFDPTNPDITKAKGGQVQTIEGPERQQNLDEFMSGVHPLVPNVLYTGTAGDFSTFDRSRANIESDLGGGFYASNNKEDVSKNYAGEGPDLTNKLERLAEHLEGAHDEEVPHEELIQHARERLGVVHKGMMMPIHMALKNPVVLGGKHETFYDLHSPYNEETDEYEEPRGKLIELHDAFRKAASEFEVPEDEINHTVGKLMEHGVDYGGLKASEVERIIKHELVNHQDPDTGDLVSNEILRKTFEHMGHDGIIDTTVNKKFGTEKRGFGNARIKGMAGVNPETIHYVAFHPHQIKSALGNRGTFDPANPDITKAYGGDVEPANMGINVRSDNKAGIRYADEIVDGNKKYETRDSDSLRPYVGKRVAIVRTGEGPARAIGEVTVGEPIVADHETFHKLRPHHLVPAGSTFDIKPGGQKYLYPMHDPVRFDADKDVGAGIVSRKVIHKAYGGDVDDNAPKSDEPTVYDKFDDTLQGMGFKPLDWEDPNVYSRDGGNRMFYTMRRGPVSVGMEYKAKLGVSKSGDVTKQDMYLNGPYVHLAGLVVDPEARQQGHGHQVMQDLTRAADTHGVNMTLQAVPFGAKKKKDMISQKKLQDFYKQHGFQPVGTAWNGMVMHRPPKTEGMARGGSIDRKFDASTEPDFEHPDRENFDINVKAPVIDPAKAIRRALMAAKG